MKIRNKNGRTHAAFNAFDIAPDALGSVTPLSPWCSIFTEINPLDKYCPELSRRAEQPHFDG
jgi:hypothetical protein